MREPAGEYEITRQRIRFRVDPPWILPGDRVPLRLAECWTILVHVDTLEADGWHEGSIIAKTAQPGTWTALSGSASYGRSGTT